MKKFWLGILISLAAAGIFLSPGYAANHSNETVVNQHTTMVMDDSMEMSHEHAFDASTSEGNTMSGEDIHKSHGSENTGEEPVVNQHTTMVMDDGMEMSHEHASDASMSEGNTMSGENIHKSHDSENAGEEPVVNQHSTMVMDDGMEMSHEHASDASTSEGNTMSGEDIHKSHGSENAGEEPNHHKHDDRTTGKAGVGPNWPFIYTFLLFNTIVVISAGVMKFRNKEVLGNGRKI